jgi:hypothetical protein
MMLRWVLGVVLSVAVVWAQPERPIRRPPNNQLALEGSDAPTGRLDAPQTVVASTDQLVFHTSPLSGKGLLSQQVEEALRAIDRSNGNATIVYVRAFVAGTGDLRRVQGVINDRLADKRLPLPAVTTVQVGSLLEEGAQVVLEAVSEERRPVNAQGVRMVAAVPAPSGAEAIAALQERMAGAAALSVTCFADSAEAAQAARQAAANSFAKVPAVFVQSTRYTLGNRVACEAMVQGGAVAKWVFASAQTTFGVEDAELQQAFDRLQKALNGRDATLADAVSVHAYATSRAIADKAKAMGASTAFDVEGLLSQDATLAVEAVVPLR